VQKQPLELPEPLPKFMKLSTTAKPNPRGVGGLSKTGEGIVALLETNALLRLPVWTPRDTRRSSQLFRKGLIKHL
jgi:hypothetical protein